MKKQFCLLVILLLCIVGQAHARKGVTYFLPKATAMFFEGNPDNGSPLITAGLVYGYGLDVNMAVEVDGNYGIAGGEYSTTAGTGDFAGWDVGAHGVYRYPVLVEGYLKAKMGLAYVHYDHNLPSGNTAESRGAEFVFGGGFGYVFKPGITLELEYTWLKSNSQNIGLGLHYAF